MMVNIALGIVVFVIASHLLMVLLSFIRFKTYTDDPGEWPFVSVLLAMRNEEMYIERCVSLLQAQDYPPDQFEILIGDDFSEDDTYSLATSLAASDQRIHVHRIRNEGKLKGKARVVAQIGEHARGEVLLITDADVRIPPDWMQGMVRAHKAGGGIITAVTGVRNEGLFTRFQHLDWILTIGRMKLATDYGIPQSTLGNNMALDGEAYRATGGFSNISLSVTEDIGVFKLFRKNGQKVVHNYSSDVLGVSEPAENLLDYLMQRKRWMKGAFRLKLWVVLFFLLETLFLPAAAILITYNPLTGAVLATVFYLSVIAVIRTFSGKLGLPVKFIDLFYPLYQPLMLLGSFVYFLLPTGTYWKGRKFGY